MKPPERATYQELLDWVLSLSPADELVNVEKAKVILGFSAETVTRWCRAGKFPGATHDGAGCKWLIPVKDLANYRKEKRQRKRRQKMPDLPDQGA